MNITTAQVKEIRTELAKLQPEKVTLAGNRTLSVKETVFALAPTLERMKKRGFDIQEIADKLGISKNGVRWNLDDMVEKGGFENREALVVTAIENKLMVTTLKDE